MLQLILHPAATRRCYSTLPPRSRPSCPNPCMQVYLPLADNWTLPLRVHPYMPLRSW